MSQFSRFKRQPLTIGLLWHSVNSDNLGIGALTAGHMAMIDKVAAELDMAVRYKVVGWRDPRPAYIQGPGIEVVALRARDLIKPGGLYAAVRSCEVVLDIGTGDGFRRHLRSPALCSRCHLQGGGAVGTPALGIEPTDDRTI